MYRLVWVICIGALVGCSSSTTEPLPAQVDDSVSTKKDKPTLYQISADISRSLLKSCRTSQCAAPLVVATPVFSSDLNQSTQFALQMQQMLINQLPHQGFDVHDSNIASTLSVSPKGELLLTRQWQKLAEQMPLEHVLVTTMSRRQDKLEVHPRIVNIETRQVVASTYAMFSFDDFAELKPPVPPPPPPKPKPLPPNVKVITKVVEVEVTPPHSVRRHNGMLERLPSKEL